jgi:putative endonuclease
MKTSRQALGKWGEDAAARHLEAHGYRVLDRNYHTSHGELDIVASLDGVLVFVEVKTRSSHSFAYPEDSVNLRKQAHLLSAAQDYLQSHPECPDNWRFDVIAIETGIHDKTTGSPEIVHFENVIT